MMGFGDFGYGGYGMSIWGWIFPILILVGVVYFVMYLTRSRAHRDAPIDAVSRAKEIAAERYARGEISEAEYQKIRDTL